MQWWCAARGETWTWTWMGYPGVWAFVAVACWLTWRLQRLGGGDVGVPAPRWRPVAAWSAPLLAWVALDWPVGPLGAGYLASVHAVQFLLLAMLAPTFAMIGVPLGAWERLPKHQSVLRAMTWLSDPFRAMLVFTMVMVFTHQPFVVDTLMGSQLGSFALDSAWMLSGLLFAYPLCAPLPVRPAFSPLLRVAYVFGGTVAHVFIGMWFLVADYPIFGTYELAPPFPGLTALQDQQVAGAVFLLIGSPLVVVAMSVIFFRWMGAGDEPDRVTP